MIATAKLQLRSFTEKGGMPRSSELKIYATLFTIMIALSFMAQLTHLPDPTDHLGASPAAHLFMNHGGVAAVRADQSHEPVIEIVSSPTHSRLFTILALSNDQYVWHGDGGSLVATGDEESALPERTFEAVPVGDGSDYVVLRTRSVDPTLNGRLAELGSLNESPSMAFRLAPLGTYETGNIAPHHAVHFRLEGHGHSGRDGSLQGHLRHRFTDSLVEVVTNDPCCSYGALRGAYHADPLEATLFLFSETSEASLKSAQKAEDIAAAEELARLNDEIARLASLFGELSQDPPQNNAAISLGSSFLRGISNLAYPHDAAYFLSHPDSLEKEFAPAPGGKPLQRDTRSKEKRVISFGLYGSNPKYISGAVRNAELQQTFFPGWVCRFYMDATVPSSAKRQLENLGAETVVMDGTSITGGIAGMFWRFLVADDPLVDIFIVRDSDSRLNARDATAVAEWISSGKAVHSIRDHPNHKRPLNGGMWGARKGFLDGAAAIIAANKVAEEAWWSSGSGGEGGYGYGFGRSLLSAGHASVEKITMQSLVGDYWNKDAYGADLSFLGDVIWPLVKDNQMSHDSYSCEQFEGSRPFPTQRPRNFQHVGQVFDSKDRPRQSDIDGFLRGKEAPLKCRLRPEWRYG